MLAQGLADIDTLGGQEGVGHAAADDEHVHAADEVFQQVDLGRHLCTADNGQNRALGRAKSCTKRFQLGLHGAAGIGGQQAGKAFGGGMGAVGGGEGIVHIEVAIGSQSGGEVGAVLFLVLVETGVLQQQHVAVLHGGNGTGRSLANAVGAEGDRAADDGSNRRGHRRKAHLRHDFTLRAAEVGQQDDLGTLVRQLADGGGDCADAGVVGDLAVLHGDVEVHTHEGALACRFLNVVDGLEGHGSHP